MVLQKLWVSQNFSPIARVSKSRFLAVVCVSQSRLVFEPVTFRDTGAMLSTNWAMNPHTGSEVNLLSKFTAIIIFHFHLPPQFTYDWINSYTMPHVMIWFLFKPLAKKDTIASSHKLKPWVYWRRHLIWPGLECTGVDLRLLVLTLVKIKFATQVDASFSPFGQPTQKVNASWVTSVNQLLAMKYRICLPWDGFLCDLRVLESCKSVWPPNVQVQLTAACDFLRVFLDRP